MTAEAKTPELTIDEIIGDLRLWSIRDFVVSGYTDGTVEDIREPLQQAASKLDALLSEVRALRGANERMAEALTTLRGSSRWHRVQLSEAQWRVMQDGLAEAQLSALRSLVEDRYSEVSQGSGSIPSSRAFGREKAQGGEP
jgi:hypothetical protein